MANHEIPRRAVRIERMHGIAADGSVVTCSVYEHTRAGHTRPVFFVVQYREVRRRIDRGSRVTREFSGAGARVSLEAALGETRRLLAESREQAARGLALV